MGIHAGILARLPNLDKAPNVKIAQCAGRQVGNEVVDIADNGKTLPAGGDIRPSLSPQNTGTAKAVAFDTSAQIGAMKPHVFMAKKRQRRAVRRPSDPAGLRQNQPFLRAFSNKRLLFILSYFPNIANSALTKLFFILFSR